MKMKRSVFPFVVLCTALLQSAYADSDISCVQQYPDDDAARLKCYDSLAAPVSVSPLAAPESSVPDENSEVSRMTATPVVAPTASAGQRSYLTKAWNLDDLSNRDPSKLGRIQPYRQTYLLLANRTSNPNRQPSSPLIDRNVSTPSDIDATEVNFQLSFKADIGDQRNIDFLGIKTFRVWWAYTQQSNWQAYNFRNSSPYCETDYEPEFIATLGTGYASGLKLINLGFVHQSNGRSLPESRGWWRVPENSLKDDNPDISDYLGRGDLALRWEPGDKSQSVNLLLRNNLHRTNNRGYMQVDWATPVNVGSAARLHVQMSSGYGESLIDYNHRQNTLGLGVSFREW